MYTDLKVNGLKQTDKITDFHSLKLRCGLVILSQGNLPASPLCSMTGACPTSL